LATGQPYETQTMRSLVRSIIRPIFGGFFAAGLWFVVVPGPAAVAAEESGDVTKAVEFGILGDPAGVGTPETRLEAYRKKYGDGLIYEVDDELKIIFGVASDERQFADLRERLAVLINTLGGFFDHPITTHVGVIIPDRWPNPRVPGHYYPHFVDARTMGSNVLHEFVHALHFADQDARRQAHRIWLVEGLACLYQESDVMDGRAVPRVDSRLGRLQDEVRNAKHFPLKTLMRLERRAFHSRHYDQARYLCLYLYQTGKLAEFYKLYTQSDDDTGIPVMERLYAKTIDEIEDDWKAWLLGLEAPAMAGRVGGASLGIWQEQRTDGVAIEHFLPDSAAKAAGLELGDVIVRINHRRVIDVEDMSLEIGGRTVGEEVEVEFRRGGSYETAVATLKPLAHPDTLPEELRRRLAE
jgi:hypothetical protein